MPQKVVGQPKMLKEVNLNIVEGIILEKGPITKPQIAMETGLSLPTVNKIVALLEENNKVQECGSCGKAVGRKARLYITNRHSGNILTLYISQTKCICCNLDMVGEVVYRFNIEIDTSFPQGPFLSLCSAIDRLLENKSAKAVAIGIGVPGIVDDKGIISSIPGIPQWEDSRIAQQIQEKYNIHTFVENNARLTAYGFYMNNLKDKYTDVVYIYIGRGISAGIIIDSKLYKGHSSFAGELGYMFVDDRQDELSQYRQTGHLEASLSELLAQINKSTNAEEILSLKAQLVEYLGRVITNFVSVINPQAVVLRGGVVTQEILEKLRLMVTHYIPERNMPVLYIDNSDLSGIRGLGSICKSLVSPAYNIIQENQHRQGD